MTEIAQNQPIELRFNRTVDPGSVNGASVSIKTAAGRVPNGKLLVRGTSIVFNPDITIVGGQTMFGFLPGETYILSLPGGPGEAQAVRSSSGDLLSHSITCSLTVSRGVIDLDGQPPRGTLLSPATMTNVPVDATFVIEFSEILDAAPFQGASTANSPIEYRVSQATNGQCDEVQARVFIAGVPQLTTDPVSRRSQVVLAPAAPLPYGACVEVRITNRVTDLAGTPAEPQVFLVNMPNPVPVAQLLVVDKPKEERSLAETFDDSAQLDREYSSGTWSQGVALPGQIGGDGVLGDFDITLGQQVGNAWVWNTDSMTIPGSHTFTGQDITVTDGIFNFSRFRVPAGTTLRFTGSNPPRIFVRGSVLIDGIIDLSGASMPEHPITVPPAMLPNPVGQTGGAGGIMGGDGGKGGDMGDGFNASPFFDGQDGETVQLLAGHAYAGAPPTGRQVGTGGTGSQQFPLDGLNTSVTLEALGGSSSAQVSAGGGGGGFMTAGEMGRVLRTACAAPGCPSEGPPAAGGSAFNLFPVPSIVPPATRLDHFLVGGSGGGGAGSHPLLSLAAMWRAGGGGAGGGGVIAFRAGGDMRMKPGAQVIVRGGSGYNYSSVPCASPGGGGSGGSCVMQIGGQVQLTGRIDAGGGFGGTILNSSFLVPVDVRAGNGGPGLILLENGTAEPPLSILGITIPAPTSVNVDPLTETDDVVGSQSKWYPTNETLPPPLLRYEMIVEQDGVDVVYSDDPAVGILAAATTPVRLFLQAAQYDPAIGVVNETSARPWRTLAGGMPGQLALVDDFRSIAALSGAGGSTAFRFLLIFDKTLSSSLRVKDFKLVYTEGTL